MFKLTLRAHPTPVYDKLVNVGPVLMIWFKDDLDTPPVRTLS
jgi:hypothetical protein